jgi:hypothetical protein
MYETNLIKSIDLQRLVARTIPEDHDFTGQVIHKCCFTNDFTQNSIEQLNLRKAFFNGSDLYVVLFKGVDIAHTEFTEASFKQVCFNGCNIKSSDFVYSVLEKCLFQDSDLANGEWRETKFFKTDFIDSKFDHTTVSLCEFHMCTFDETTFSGLLGPSVNYNVFIDCEIPPQKLGSSFFNNNFGVKISKGRIVDGKANKQETLSDAARLFYIGDLSLVIFQRIFMKEFSGFVNNGASPSQVKVQYFFKVAMTYHTINQTPLIQLQAILDDLMTFLGRIQAEQSLLFMESTKFVFFLRQRIDFLAHKIKYSIENTLHNKNLQIVSGCIKLPTTHSKEVCSYLMHGICIFCNIPDGSLRWEHKTGSTEILFEAKQMIETLPDPAVWGASLMAFLGFTKALFKQTSLNLKELSNVIDSAESLKQSIKKFSSSEDGSSKENKKELKTKKASSKQTSVAAILSGHQKYPFNKEVKFVLQEMNGYVMEFDTEAEIDLVVK